MKKKKITRGQLVKMVALDFNCNVKDAKEIVDIIFGRIITEVDNGRILELRGFGVFSSRLNGAVNKFVPPKNKVIKLKPRLTVTFKPSKAFTSKINGK